MVDFAKIESYACVTKKLKRKTRFCKTREKKLEAMASEEKISKLSEDKRKLRKKAFKGRNMRDIGWPLFTLVILFIGFGPQ